MDNKASCVNVIGVNNMCSDKRVKNILKHIYLIKFFRNYFSNKKIDINASIALKKERTGINIVPNNKIRVVFLCQYIPAWNKERSTYDRMLGSEEFEPILLCVPSNIINNALVGQDRFRNDTYDYFISKGYSQAINALKSNVNGIPMWYSLKTLKPDYVIYNRPYNSYLPVEYTDQCVCKYSRCCLVMYSTSVSSDFSSTTLNRDFLAYTYFYFANTEEMKIINEKRNSYGHKKKLQHSVTVGMLPIEDIYNGKHEKSDSWNFSKNKIRIIWSPRWSTDPKIGGSNFFEYKDFFYELAKKYPNIDFLYRPHPMMWENFIRKGQITEDEKNDYIEKCETLPNIRFDTEEEYNSTIWKSSLLISDISGFIPEYLVTGKPVIYCLSKDIDFSYTDQGVKIIEACYRVKNKSEIEDKIINLINGIDPLKEKRKKLVQEEFLCGDKKPSEIICDSISNDYHTCTNDNSVSRVLKSTGIRKGTIL